MPFLRFLTRLVKKWYVVLAAVLGLSDVAEKALEAFGYKFPSWAQIPRGLVLPTLLVAVIYGAYLVALESFAEGERRGREENARLGELRLDIIHTATVAYSSRDGASRYAVVHGILRSSAPSAVRVTGFRLMDADHREYGVINASGGIATTMGHMMLGDAFYEPSGVLIIEPNRPSEVAILFSTAGGGWDSSAPTASFSIVVQDDLGRFTRTEFSCRINR